MPAGKHINEDCVVCTETSHGYHFGVVACRACAAFFRRTIALSLRYRCRFDGRCTIDKSVRCLCRACRLCKCLAAGMQPSAVQLKRDLIGRNARKNAKTETRESDSSPYSEAPASVSTPPLTDTRAEIYNKVNAVFERAIQRHPTDQRCSLTKMLDGYLAMLKERPRVHAGSMLLTRSSDMSPEENEARVRYNTNTFLEMCRLEAVLYAEMLTHFHPFMELPREQRWLMYKHFWSNFLKFERVYASHIETQGEPNSEEISVFVNGFRIETSRIHSELYRSSSITESDLQKIFAVSTGLTVDAVNRPLRALNPSPEEFIAMTAFILYQHPAGITRATLAQCDAARGQIFDQLHEYYASIGLDAYASRLAQLMSIVFAVEQSVAQRREDLLIVEMCGSPDEKYSSLVDLFRA